MDSTSTKTVTDEQQAQPTALRAASPSTSFGTGYGKETPISIPPTITFGVQNTHTTILPYLTYFSVSNLNYSATDNPIS